jgi:putative photosynthetic complex assembly protein 2
MNALFPVSVTAATAALVLLAQQAAAPEASAFDATGYALLATLAALGLWSTGSWCCPFPWRPCGAGASAPAPRSRARGPRP